MIGDCSEGSAATAASAVPPQVFLNGQRLSIKSFSDYVDLYLGPKDGGIARVYERVSDRWEVCIAATDGQFNQVSFVNSICTVKGGTHVNYIVDQVTKCVIRGKL